MTTTTESKVTVTQGGKLMPELGSVVCVTYDKGDTMEYVVVRSSTSVGTMAFNLMPIKGLTAFRLCNFECRTITQLVEVLDSVPYANDWYVLSNNAMDMLYGYVHI